MDDRAPDPRSDSRKRKLDELFADEPFLSPTMKARMLHERLQNDGHQEAGLPTEAFVAQRPANGAAPKSPGPADIGLGEAARILRAIQSGQGLPGNAERSDSEAIDRLRRMREQLLLPWLRHLPDTR